MSCTGSDQGTKPSFFIFLTYLKISRLSLKRCSIKFTLLLQRWNSLNNIITRFEKRFSGNFGLWGMWSREKSFRFYFWEHIHKVKVFHWDSQGIYQVSSYDERAVWFSRKNIESKFAKILTMRVPMKGGNQKFQNQHCLAMFELPIRISMREVKPKVFEIWVWQKIGEQLWTILSSFSGLSVVMPAIKTRILHQMFYQK